MGPLNSYRFVIRIFNIKQWNFYNNKKKASSEESELCGKHDGNKIILLYSHTHGAGGGGGDLKFQSNSRSEARKSVTC